ncbi:hypothetical protein PILCRDRAFT_821865 [Piloderma croceum F 1598]|uniref:Mid2 domain-containing protein n=1 Tax=Piloderma croceum (strain F 1598) TaxID=765440 RepID=A0A0C3B474_PILCF|nr:hypothetical protein PILCRDRAFT_821865 [Piloderma croceum F 1598]
MLGLVPIFFFFLSLCWLASADTNFTVFDNQIIWPSSAPLWTPTPTTCSSEGQAHFAYQANMSMSYEFSGTAIYLSILRSNVTGVYTIFVDNASTIYQIDGFHATTICDVQLGVTGLSFGPHTVTVTLVGQSPQAQNASPNPYLELDAFIYTTPGDSSTSTSVSPTTSSPATDSPSTDSSATVSPTSTAIPVLADASKSTLKASSIAGIVIAFLASLVVMAAFFIFLHRRNKHRSVMHRKTLIDDDSVLASHISQFPPPRSDPTHQPNIFPDVSLMSLTDMTDAESQTSPHPQWGTSGSMARTDGVLEEAPPVYEAPGGKSGLHGR